MAALPYMNFYVGDYLADTMHLSTLEHGAYLLLIMHYWRTGKPIDISHIPSICGLTKRQFNNIKNTLLAFFFVDELGKVRHHRIEVELNEAKQKVNQRKAAGKASAAKRLQEKSNERSTSVEFSLDSRSTGIQQAGQQPEPEPEPDTETDKTNPPISPPSKLQTEIFEKEQGLDLDGFFVFYEKNDWHVGKGDSREPMADWKATAAAWSKRRRSKAFDNESIGFK